MCMFVGLSYNVVFCNAIESREVLLESFLVMKDAERFLGTEQGRKKLFHEEEKKELF